MNVNTAIKNIKAELDIVKAENKKFKDADAAREIQNVDTGIKDLKNYIEYMLDMDNAGCYDHRYNMIKTVNFCYEGLSQANFHFYMKCGSFFLDSDEYTTAKLHYGAEEERLRCIKL